MSVGVVAAGFVAAYLVGSIPFGWVIGRMKGVDIRERGSRNIGATNCGRVCGAPWGVLAFLLDVAKGFLPVFLAARYVLPAQAGAHGPQAANLLLVAVAIAPILGHVFPVWLRFRGGKAVATSLGVVAAMPMLWAVALLAFGIWILVVLVTRYVSVASSVAALIFAGGYLVFDWERVWDDYLAVTVFVFVLVVVVLIRHRSNYARLLRGEENRIWGGPPASAPNSLERPPLDQDATIPSPEGEGERP